MPSTLRMPFRPERLTSALLDDPMHHVNILEMHDESYRLAQGSRHQLIETELTWP